MGLFDALKGRELVPLSSRLRLILLRPQDHLVLSVSGIGLAATVGDDGIPRLVPGNAAAPARLIVTFPPQHVAEQVFQEHLQGGHPEQPALPAGARFAAPSRLAFDVPAGEQIPLTVAGILAAMSRLPLGVAALAAPRTVLFPWQTLTGISPVTSGLAAALAGSEAAPVAAGAGLTMERLRASRILAATLLGGGVRALDPEARVALLAIPAADRPTALASLARISGIDLTGIVRLLRNPDPRPPLASETAIEVPSRLQLSPSVDGGWAHATLVAQELGDGTGPVELWHSRLGVRIVAPDGTVSVDETDPTQRTVRAVWTRDVSAWGHEPPPPPPELPFRMSTAPSDRYEIVGLSTGAGMPIWSNPNPVEVNRLALSSLGAFVDVRGAWPLTPPYSLAEWQHRTTLGRDQYVKVVHFGYLFPFGHRAVYVVETRRKVDPTLPHSADTAILWQREFVLLRERTLGYGDRSMPFTSITLSPLGTPDLDDPGQDPPFFWPQVGGNPFPFTVSAVDHDGSTHVFTAPLLWVKASQEPGALTQVLTAYGLAKDAEGFRHTAPGDGRVELPLAGRHIAVAPSAPSGEATYETRILRFAGDPGTDTATPSLLFTDVLIPAVTAVSGQRNPLRLGYAQPYLASGFDQSANPGEVVLQTARDAAAGALSFTNSSDRSGGFLDPSQTIDGVSRRLGPVADVASSALGSVDPAKLFGSVGKLFGLFNLADILPASLQQMPAYAAKALDLTGALDGELGRLAALLPDAPAQVAAAKAALAGAASGLGSLTASPPANLTTAITDFQALIDTQLLPAVQGAAQDAVIGSLDPGQRAIVSRALDTVTVMLKPPGPLPLSPAEMLARLARGEPVASLLNHVHLEWSPPLQEWPPGLPIFQPSLGGEAGALLLAVDVRSGDLVSDPSAEIIAQLTNFSLQLLPDATLLQIGFKRLLFKAGTGNKSDVEVVLDGLQWQGVLGFVETLKDMIPMDGFSDPPSLEVDSSGITAGFSVGLPNLAIGVFNLSNLSLGADLKLPFIGDSPTVGFSFCSRERPFTLAVMFLGGGGFFGLRLSPKGVVLLEASLEFGACLALDFGVASGSVSCMAGVYLRLEASDGSLTGYLRIRGEVEVLDLISASIEMYMGLTYEFGSGKVIGTATITVEVEVLLFSASVQISCERKFAGSNGDPTFAQVMGPYADDGPWVAYCQAFAEA
ncbi:MAG: hypothetical protein QOF83_1080 [Solirubrobacteraceae bacterium]|jgi:hypothetical protein|nr:hypothetical protein [Solirubrobacteraceae bacterium]